MNGEPRDVLLGARAFTGPLAVGNVENEQFAQEFRVIRLSLAEGLKRGPVAVAPGVLEPVAD